MGNEYYIDGLGDPCGYVSLDDCINQLRELGGDWEDFDLVESISGDVTTNHGYRAGYSVERLAIMIHREVCDCDDKRCPVPGQIEDWLRDGDLNGVSYWQLVAEWREQMAA